MNDLENIKRLRKKTIQVMLKLTKQIDEELKEGKELNRTNAWVLQTLAGALSKMDVKNLEEIQQALNETGLE